jgi:5,10-methylenetetrahydromethanopterin reductase
VKFGVELVPYLPLDTLVALASRIERAGFDYIWVCDHYHNRFVHSVLARLALTTERVRLGPGVTNPYLIHPAATAAAIATLDEISGGRAVLGISSGELTFLATIGVEPRKPVVAVRETVQIVRKLLKGKRVDFEGEIFTCRGAKLRVKPTSEVPIYIGARKPRMLKLAGEIADGVLINASHHEDLRRCVANVRKGAKSAGRKLGDLDVVAYMAVSVDSDIKKARAAARRVVAFVASSTPRSALKRHGIPFADIDRVRRHLRKGDILKAAEAVTDQMIDAFAVCGTPAELRAHVGGLAKSGITQVVIGFPIGPKPTQAIDPIAKALL